MSFARSPAQPWASPPCRSETHKFKRDLLHTIITFRYSLHVIELKHLRLLRAIQSQGTLSGAARELGCSQPAITQQVQGLERYLKTPLLVRGRRGIQLSQAGLVLLRHSEQILTAVSLAEAEVEAVAGLRAGRIRVASFPSAAAALLPQTFAAIKAEHPGLSIEMVEANPPRAFELLRSGECDLAVVYSRSTGGEVTEEVPLEENEVLTPLLVERVHVALPASHEAAARRWVNLGDLEDATWIAGCPLCRSNLLRACRAVGFTPRIGFQTNDYLALHRLAALGLGVALVPELMHAVAPSDSALVFRPLEPLNTRRVGAVTTEALMHLPGVRRMLDELQRSAQDLGLADAG